MFLTQEQAEKFVGGDIKILFRVPKSDITSVSTVYRYRGQVKTISVGNGVIKVTFVGLMKKEGNEWIPDAQTGYFMNLSSYSLVNIQRDDSSRAIFTSRHLQETLVLQSPVHVRDISTQERFSELSTLSSVQ